MKYIDIFIVEFGFNNFVEFSISTFGYSIKTPILITSLTLATIGTLVENFIGLDPVVYSAFMLLISLEFCTGIKASLKEGVKIRSKRFGRFILKLIVYTILIGIINIFRTRLEIPEAFGIKINIYSLIYFLTLNLIIFQLILSVFENLTRLGFEETNKIYKAISKILKKYLDLK